MIGYAFFSQTALDYGQGLFEYRKADGEMVLCTAFCQGEKPWAQTSYFADARSLGPVEEFVRVVEPPNIARQKFEKMKWRKAP